MNKEGKNFSIALSESSLDLDLIFSSLGDDDELKDRIRTAPVVFIPTDLRPEYEGWALPDSTRDIFRYIRSGLAEVAVVEAAVRDDDYKEFAHLSEQLIIPTLYIASNTLLSLVVNLLGSYIYDKLKNRGGSNSKDTVTSELHFRDRNGTQLSLKYDGPASTYEKVASEHIKELGLWVERNESSDACERNDCS